MNDLDATELAAMQQHVLDMTRAGGRRVAGDLFIPAAAVAAILGLSEYALRQRRARGTDFYARRREGGRWWYDSRDIARAILLRET